MRKWTKAVSLLCAATMVSALLAGCSSAKKNSSSSTGSSSSSQVTAANAPTLVWWTIGTQPTNLAQGVAEMNKYTAQKIGVKIDIKVASWGDWDTKMNTIINAGQSFDMMFTNNTKYNQQVSDGAFEDITSAVQQQTPDLYKAIPENVWKGTEIGGKVYAVPTYKDSSATQFWMLDDTYVQKYHIDVNSIKTMQDLDKPFREIKAGEGKNFYPLELTQSDAFSGLLNNYDDMTLGFQPLGVKVTDSSRKVVSVLEQPDVMANLKLLHSWYQDGIINPDAPTATEPIKHRAFQSAQGWPSAAATWETNDGVKKYDLIQVYGPEYTTSSIQGSMNAISANSKYKAEALKYLQLVNTDSKLRNMLAFGIEGTTFKYDSANVVTKLNDSWSLPAYAQGTFFDMATTSDSPSNEWDQVKKQNEEATASTCLGFALNTSNLTNQIANCNEVWNKYRYELMTGASDPTTTVPKIVSELKSAGMGTIQTEAQKQIDAYFKQ